MSPRILISQRAAKKLFAEVRRWVETGLLRDGVPAESLVYPLSALVPRQELKTPVELLSADHVEELVIDDVAVPPDEIKVFSAANCHFAGDLESANARFNSEIDAKLAAQPRLGVNSKLHTHPFLQGDFLSQGDIYHGVQAPKAMVWRERRGLRTAVLHVVYPDRAPQPTPKPWRLRKDGAEARGSNGSVIWRIRSWASVSEADDLVMRDLGDALVVDARHPSVRAARRSPYFQTRRGASWCDTQKAALRDAGYHVSRNTLGRGWRRYLVRTSERQLLFALPPDFPSLPPRVLEVRRAWADDFEELPLPSDFPQSYRASLVALARAYGRPTVPDKS